MEAELTFCRRDGERFPVLITAGTVRGPRRRGPRHDHDGQGHLGAQALRGAAGPARRRGPADRAAQPPLVPRAPRRGVGARTERRSGRSRSSCWTSTTSSRSTTRSATRSGTRCSSRSRRGSRRDPGGRAPGARRRRGVRLAAARGRRGRRLAAAERAREAIRATPFALGGTLTISAGVCTLADAGGESRELYRLADTALYRAKAAGRDRVMSFGPVPAATSVALRPGPPLSPRSSAGSAGPRAARRSTMIADEPDSV